LKEKEEKMKEYLNKITQGDCLDLLKKLPSESIAGCITDPPYNYEFIGKSWDYDEIQRRINNTKINNSKTLVKNIPYGSGLSGGVRNKNWYRKNRENIIEYRKWVEKWADEIYRVLKPGSYALIFNSTRTSAHIQVAFEDVGFYARDTIVWRRSSGIPKGLNVEKKLEKMGNKNYKNWKGWHSALRNEWEAITVVQKPLINNYINTLEKYNVGLLKTQIEGIDGFQSNILENIPRDTKNDYNTHVTIKPLALIKKLIEMTIPPQDGNIVIDPFIGSGTTGVAAEELGIDWIGFELNPEYIKIAQRRLLEQKNIQTNLFD
jgi:DNA (cytosine-5-)-methyltransferase